MSESSKLLQATWHSVLFHAALPFHSVPLLLAQSFTGQERYLECNRERFHLSASEDGDDVSASFPHLDPKCTWTRVPGWTFLPGHTEGGPAAFRTLQEAQHFCVILGDLCGGVTAQECSGEPIYTPRAALEASVSPHAEISWLKNCGRDACAQYAPHPPDATMGSTEFVSLVENGPYGELLDLKLGSNVPNLHRTHRHRGCWHDGASFVWYLMRRLIIDATVAKTQNFEANAQKNLMQSLALGSNIKDVEKCPEGAIAQDAAMVAIDSSSVHHACQALQILEQEICQDVEAAVVPGSWPLIQLAVLLQDACELPTTISATSEVSADERTAIDAIQRRHLESLSDVLPRLRKPLPRSAALLELAIHGIRETFTVLSEVSSLLQQLVKPGTSHSRILPSSHWPVLNLLNRFRMMPRLQMFQPLPLHVIACEPGHSRDTWHVAIPDHFNQLFDSQGGTPVDRHGRHSGHVAYVQDDLSSVAYNIERQPKSPNGYLALRCCFGASEAPKRFYMSMERPTIGLFVEDLRAEVFDWSQAFLNAVNDLGLPPPHIILNVNDALPGVFYFSRLTRFIAQGAVAYSSGVSSAAESLLRDLFQKGCPVLPRPEDMSLYENKPLLWRLFSERGVAHPHTVLLHSAAAATALEKTELSKLGFPVVLKHPHAAGSESMSQCDLPDDLPRCVHDWLSENVADSVIVQRRVNFTREVRVTFVYGRIVHYYWRVKSSSQQLSAATKFGSQLDFNFPERESLGGTIRRWVSWFAEAMDVHIGAVDFCWEGDDFSKTPLVFEVSPVFDMNPPPPVEFKELPYKDLKTEAPDQYRILKQRTYTSLYAAAIPLALCYRRSNVVYVDVDNTVADARPRIRRWARPTWPGERIDSNAYSAVELQSDPVLGNAVEAIRRISQNHAVIFLSARGRWHGAYEATVKWLEVHGFPFSAVQLVDRAQDKASWLLAERDMGRNIALLVDDLSVDHHKLTSHDDQKTQALLTEFGLPYHTFRFQQADAEWQSILQLLGRIGSPMCGAHARARDAMPSAVPR